MENGAPGTIRTSDPQIRSLDPFIDPTSFPCKPGTKQSLTLQGVKTPTANQFDLIPAAPATPIATELHAHFAAGGTVAEGMRLVELLERGAQMAKRRNEATGRGTRLPRTSNRPLPKSLSPSIAECRGLVSTPRQMDPKIPFLADVADMRLFCRTGARPRQLATAHMNALVSGRRSGRKLQYSRTTNVAHGLRGCRPPGSGLRRAPAVAQPPARGVHNGYQLECRARSPPAVHP